MFNNFYFPKIAPFMKLCGKYSRARQVTDENIIQRMRLACWITQAVDTHPKYAILFAFALQDWLREGTSVLYLYVHCLRFLFLV